MGVKKLLILSIVMGGIAVFLTADSCIEYRKQIKSTVDVFLKTCPYHVVLDYWKKMKHLTGFSVEEEFDVVRHEKDRLFTKSELSQYTGVDGSLGLYLAILGRVYDVASGAKHYEPGAAYSFFTGKDGTKAFVTGDFTDEGLVDDTTGLDHGQMLEIETWIKFYEDNYSYRGKVIGNFYDENGSPTPALMKANEAFDAAHHQKSLADAEKRAFPPCNSRWSQADGTVVWCSDKSGGIQRDWAGVPMRFFKPGMRSPRCACVCTTGPPHDNPADKSNAGDLASPHVQSYEGCTPGAAECKIVPNKP